MAPTFLALLAQQLRALLRDKGVALLVVGAPWRRPGWPHGMRLRPERLAHNAHQSPAA